MKKLLLAVLTAGLIVSGCGQKIAGPLGPTSPATSVITQEVGAAGGTVSAGMVNVVIPAGALAANVNITLAPVAEGSLPASLGSDKTYVSAATFGPEGQTFTTAVTITFALKEAGTPGAALSLLLYNATTGLWTSVGNAIVSADGKTAVASVTHFCTYSVAKLSGGTHSATVHNHFIMEMPTKTGYFDFSANAEVVWTDTGYFLAGDFVFKSYGADVTYFGCGDGATDSIQELSATSLDAVTSAPTTGWKNEETYNLPTAQYINKIFAVKTKEGGYVVFQVTDIDTTYVDSGSGHQWPKWITFNWKELQ